MAWKFCLPRDPRLDYLKPPYSMNAAGVILPGDQVLMMTDGVFDLGGDQPPTPEELDRTLRAHRG